MTVFLYPTPTPILPALNGFSTHKRPTWASMVAEPVSKRELTAARQAYPLWEFELTYEVLASQTENQVPYVQNASQYQLEQIEAVFLACKGQYGRFYYDDPTDNSRLTQLLGTSTGTETNYTVLRSIGTSVALYLLEPVGGVNAGQPWTIYQNGADDTSNWTLAGDFRSWTRSSPLGAGVVVTADFFFYYLCRFLEDITDFEQFYANLWSIKSLKFRSVKS